MFPSPDQYHKVRIQNDKNISLIDKEKAKLERLIKQAEISKRKIESLREIGKAHAEKFVGAINQSLTAIHDEGQKMVVAFWSERDVYPEHPAGPENDWLLSDWRFRGYTDDGIVIQSAQSYPAGSSPLFVYNTLLSHDLVALGLEDNLTRIKRALKNRAEEIDNDQKERSTS